MQILHTSDWHLGRTLYGRKRYEEFAAFLDWLAAVIEEHDIGALLVAGDIFDTSAPSNRAQELYYRFLCRVAASPCRHVVVTAGNHDSPSFLNAPRELLRALDVHVVGTMPENPEEEILVLCDAAGAPELIVCAVPYLRDRDIRTAEAGESIEDKERKLLDGIRRHYAEVAALAETRRQEPGSAIPIVAMGHLFTAGGRTVEGDGVRELYVGSLAHVAAAALPADFDYLALGHLHVPQEVHGRENYRYSGSPLAMGFGEAGQEKSVCLVEFSGAAPAVRLLKVPVFQPLERIRGDWRTIADRLGELASAGSRAWLEIVYDGDEVISDLRERLDMTIEKTNLEILRVKNSRISEQVLRGIHDRETLDDLQPEEVFARCLAAHGVPDEQQAELIHAYRETLVSLEEEDSNAA